MKIYKLPILSGILMGTSYIPFPPWALLFCYAPLFVFCYQHRLSVKKVFLGAWITQFILSIIGFHWISFTAHEFGRLNWPISVLVLILFASFIHMYVPISLSIVAILNKKINFKQSIFFIACACSYYLLESFWPSIFPWNLGYPWLWAQLPIYNLSELIGFSGLSFLTILSSAVLGFAYLYEHLKKYLLKIILLFVALNIVGLGLQKKFEMYQSQLELQNIGVLQVQANIGNAEKIYAEKGAKHFQAEILNRFLNLTNLGIELYQNQQNKKIDLIVWPETAFQDYLNPHYIERNNQQKLLQFLKNQNLPLFTGSYSKNYEATPDNPFNDTYNGIFLVQPDGAISNPYHKTHLLAFGEYLPLSEKFHSLRDAIPFVSNFGRGAGPMLIPFENIQIGSQVCYEGLYPNFSASLTQMGADLFINLTNDSWFGKHFEPRQHLYMTFARAIENRRPLIRSTNTGITTAILADGTILQKSPIDKEWHGHFDMKIFKNTKQTFFTRIGQYFHFLILTLTIALIGISYAKRTH